LPKKPHKKAKPKRRAACPEQRRRVRKKPPSSASSAPSVAKSSAAAAKRQDALRRYLAGQPLTSHQTRLVCDYIRPLLDRVPQKLVVDLLATTRKVLGEWAEQGAPRNDDATWPLGKLLRWVKKRWGAHRRGAGAGDPDGVGPDGQLPLELDWEKRLKKAKALAAERSNAEAEGTLVRRDLVEDLFGQMADVLTAALRRAPDLAPSLAQVTPSRARQVLTAYRDRARSEISDAASRCAGSLSEPEGKAS